jgi:hypothetical protein
VKLNFSYQDYKQGSHYIEEYTNDDLAVQTRSMMEIFGTLHPDCIALIAFDNSSDHHAMAKDALVASRLNLKDGGKMFCSCVRAGTSTTTENVLSRK